jgi:hypothetical protein
MALGRKTGGRTKGVVNKRTGKVRAAIASSGLMPLDFMLAQLRNAKLDVKDRMYAATQAAPYLHPRLTQVDAKVSGDIIIEVVRFGENRRQAA